MPPTLAVAMVRSSGEDAEELRASKILTISPLSTFHNHMRACPTLASVRLLVGEKFTMEYTEECRGILQSFANPPIPTAAPHPLRMRENRPRELFACDVPPSLFERPKGSPRCLRLRMQVFVRTTRRPTRVAPRCALPLDILPEAIGDQNCLPVRCMLPFRRAWSWSFTHHPQLPVLTNAFHARYKPVGVR